ncbi:MAG TPA: hypothetical protein VH008_32045 [Pseudonocardia sp.]|jgi:hypothetical protein|nr:hypothetical protein [Pseudonocardia sp.]
MPKPDPNASDWSDLDLLTVSEATERLDEEIAAVHASIEALSSAGTGGGARPAEVQQADPAAGALLAEARHRLELLERARVRAAKPSVAITPGRVRTRAEIDATPGPPD